MTQQTDIVQQAVAYCRHQAGKGTDSLAGLMERTGADWQRTIEGMSEGQAAFAPGHEWPAKQVVNHFLEVTAGVNKQVAKLTGGTLPSGPLDEESLAAQGKAAPAESVPVMQERLSAIFGEIVTITHSLEGNAHLQEEFPHPMFGQLNILEWIAFQRLHSMDHMQQIEKNKADAGYPQA